MKSESKNLFGETVGHRNRNGHSFAALVVMLASGVAAGISSSPALAEEAPMQDPTKPQEKALVRTGDPCTQKDGMQAKALQMTGEYCAAADAADEAAKNQEMLMGVHAGVAALCMIPCIQNGFMGTGELTMGYVCSGASIAAGVTDVVVTKQFTGAVGAAMGAYGLYQSIGAGKAAKEAAKAAVNPAGKAAGKEAKQDSGKMSCMTAAVEGGMAVMNHMGAQDSKETAEENRKLAAEVVDTALAPLPGFLGSAAPAVARAPSLSGGGQNGFGGGTSVPGGVNANDGGNLRPLLSSAGSCTGSFANRLNCASARGVRIPPAARMPGFIPALEKASGLPIDQLMSRGDPGSIMGAVTGGALGGETGSAVQAAMAQASQNLRDSRGQPSAATYAGGGGGGGSAASDDGMGDLTKAFGNLMEGMTKKPEDADSTRGREEEFGDRKIASNGRPIEEDRSISLFDRISRRYRASQERMAAYRFTSATNRALSR